MSVVISASGLGADRGGRTVLDDVSLDLERGEVVALLGPNGAGKTTLLTLLAGIAHPDRGSIERAGRVATGLQTPAMARRTVLANVEAGLAWWGVPRSERRQRALRALEDVGMGTMTDRAARSLSGGEARRVHLARVLATDPDALLLDEPFAGLDVSARADLLYEAASILRAPGRATLIVVHDRAEAWALADRVVVLLDGRVAAAGAPGDVFRRPPTAKAAAFLGFSGQITDGDGVLLLRPEDVALDEAGPLRGRVVRRVPLEEGARLEVDVPDGRLVVSAPIPGPGPGDAVRLRVSGGVRYPRDEADARAPTTPAVPSTQSSSSGMPPISTEGGT